MRHWRTLVRLAMTLLLAVPIILAGSPDACACSCRMMTMAEKVAEFDVIVEGEVISERPATREESGEDMPMRLATMRVTQVYKGQVPAEMTIITPDQQSACAAPLPSNGVVVIFSTTPRGSSYLVNSCSGSGGLTDAERQELIAAAGPGTPMPSPTSTSAAPSATPSTGSSAKPSSPETTSSSGWRSWVVGAAGLALLLTALFVVIRVTRTMGGRR